MDITTGTTYLSLRVDVPLRTAAAAFDDLRPSFDDILSGLSDKRARFRTRAQSARDVPVPRRPAYLTYRAVDALVVAPRVRRPVELELTPWSAKSVELGLRTSAGLLRRPSDPAFEHGYAILARLRQLIAAWADEPLRAMTATPAELAPLTRCYLLVQADPGSTQTVIEEVRALPSVAEATATTGSYDVFVTAAGDSSRIRDLPAALRRLPGVSRVLICLPAP